MNIKHHKLDIPQENPFENCKLEREHFAQILTNIVATYADGFVMAINNEWGTGKTTFVKMWEQYLRNKGFQTIYFNAWENDFDSNPLVAIMSELETLTNDINKKVFKSVIKKGAVLVKNVAPALIKSLIKKYVADVDEVALDVIKNTSKASTEILEEAIKEYTSKKKTIIEFRHELEKFIKQSDNSKPLIFIIDELDRCRPNYAVEVLEQIKHFFSVSGIVFVLSIDKNHLTSSVKGFYGSEHIDGDEYLRRFIDLEYSIPRPSTKRFIDYLFVYYGFREFFYEETRKKISEFSEDSNNFLRIAETLFIKSGATLRQQERVFALSRLVLLSFKKNEYVLPHLLIVLVYLKTMKNEIFKKIERNDLPLQGISDAFFDIVNSDKPDASGLNIIYVEALFLWMYNNNQDRSKRIKLLERNTTGEFISPVKSRLEAVSSRWNLVQCFEQISSHHIYDGLRLDHLMRKVNLTEAIVIQ